MKKNLLLGAVTAALILFTACGGDTAEKLAATGPRIGIVYSTGGKGDKSFNDSAYRGLKRAQEELGVSFSEYEPTDPTKEAQDQLSQYAESGEYDLIVAVGFSMKDALIAVARQFPEQKFVIIDETVDTLSNIASLNFKEHEGSFLVGALASMMSKSGVVGFIGGVEVPLIQKFETGYIQGAKYVNPNARVLSLYIGGTSGFNDPANGKLKTEALIQQGADVIYHAAGATGLGVFQAVNENNIYGIGVDSNQDDLYPGKILTSMVKNVDIALFDIIKTVVEGSFTAQVYDFGVKEDGVSTSDFAYTKDIIGTANIKALEDIKSKIISGEIVVRSTK